jgi:hypothetical protein
MKIILHNNPGSKIIEFISKKIILNNPQDALDLMVMASEKGAVKIILQEKNMHPDFFRLKTGLAGEILQKFVNYHIKLAITGDFKKYTSKNLQSFISECNSGNQFFFVSDISKALEILEKS